MTLHCNCAVMRHKYAQQSPIQLSSIIMTLVASGRYHGHELTNKYALHLSTDSALLNSEEAPCFCQRHLGPRTSTTLETSKNGKPLPLPLSGLGLWPPQPSDQWIMGVSYALRQGSLGVASETHSWIYVHKPGVRVFYRWKYIRKMLIFRA